MFTKSVLEEEHHRCRALLQRPREPTQEELENVGLYRFYKELDLAASGLEDYWRLEQFGTATDALIEFLCECHYWGGVRVQEILVIVFSAFNCAAGLKDTYPEFALPHILGTARRRLIEEIGHAAKSPEQLKAALVAESWLFESLESTVLEENFRKAHHGGV